MLPFSCISCRELLQHSVSVRRCIVCLREEGGDGVHQLPFPQQPVCARWAHAARVCIPFTVLVLFSWCLLMSTLPGELDARHAGCSCVHTARQCLEPVLHPFRPAPTKTKKFKPVCYHLLWPRRQDLLHALFNNCLQRRRRGEQVQPAVIVNSNCVSVICLLLIAVTRHCRVQLAKPQPNR